MKILVGTLYSGENEFNECVSAINRQKGAECEHFVLKDLSNKKAHETLYGRFMESSENFDIFIKVDADMVIEDEELFSKIAAKFRNNSQLENLEIAVHDFFSNQLIMGMHAYRNTVNWYPSDEDLFVDYNSIAPDRHIRDDKELAPAALHCKNPSFFHSFHFGIHRALKVIQPGRSVADEMAGRYHFQILEKTRANFLKTGDRRYAFAVLGAAIVFKGSIKVKDIDYTNPTVRNLFKKYEAYDEINLEKVIRRLSLTSFGFLKNELRYDFLMTFSQVGRIRFLPCILVKMMHRILKKSVFDKKTW